MFDITNFLIEAKKNTYANANSVHAISSRRGSKDYHFEGKIEGKKAEYHDTYFGGENFIGEEVVYLNSEKPIWGMNYYGYAVVSSLSEEVMDNALRPALMQVGADKSVLPLRGPSKYVNGDYLYTFENSGTMECFVGVERIYKNDRLVYELHCAGGTLR